MGRCRYKKVEETVKFYSAPKEDALFIGPFFLSQKNV
jgi:hypothetical protein